MMPLGWMAHKVCRFGHNKHMLVLEAHVEGALSGPAGRFDIFGEAQSHNVSDVYDIPWIGPNAVDEAVALLCKFLEVGA